MPKDYIIGLGLEVVKDKITDSYHEEIAKKRLEDFINNQTNINFNCRKDEEIDFGATIDYLRTNFLDDVKTRLWGDREHQKAAYKNMYQAAVSYARAHTKLGKARAVHLVETAFKILKAYYRQRVNRELLFLSGEIIESLEKSNEDQHTKQTSTIIDAITANSNRLEEIHELLTRDPYDAATQATYAQLIGQDYTGAESFINALMDKASQSHIYAPDYGFALSYKNGKHHLVSVPRSDNAKKEYRKKFKCIGSFRIGDKHISRLTPEALDYSHRHQEPIIFNVSEAEKYLGSKPDPIQDESAELVGTNFVIPPEPFPKAFPCSISLDQEIEFGYILFRTKEILDDGTFVISNYEQSGYPFELTILLNPNSKTMAMQICVLNPTNSNILKYDKILKRANEGALVTITTLDNSIELAEGKLGAMNYETEFGSIEEEIRFLEMIVSIEKHFNLGITIPNDIYEIDYLFILYLTKLINGEAVATRWDTLDIPVELTEQLQNAIACWDGSTQDITIEATMEVPLWGETFSLPITRTYHAASAVNPDKVKAKASVMDPGDTFTISFCPEDPNNALLHDVISSQSLPSS